MFIICVKSSHSMGMGHLFRAITLYSALKRNNVAGAVVLFGYHAEAAACLDNQHVPYSVVEMPDDEGAGWEEDLVTKYRARIWINDRMQTDAEHAARIKALGLKLVTFDDTGSGARLCDLHVAPLAIIRRDSLEGNRRLVGLEYLVLPPELVRYRRLRTDDQRWVVSLGGSDTHGVTLQVIRWLNEHDKHATIILGPAFAHSDELARLDSAHLVIKRSVPSLIEEFFYHDIAITGGGLTAFEAAAAGLPTVVVANEPWEELHGKHLESLGCSRFAGHCDAIEFGVFQEIFDVKSMSRAALTSVPTDGVEKVVRELLAMIQTERR